MAFRVCGWEARDLKVVLEERWTTADISVYERESALFPDPGALVTSDRLATVRTSRPAEAIAALRTIQRENPAEPFFSGLVEMVEVPTGVQLEFTASERPELLPVVAASGVGPTSVACHLYPAGGLK